jgi:hypothetical protein
MESIEDRMGLIEEEYGAIYIKDSDSAQKYLDLVTPERIRALALTEEDYKEQIVLVDHMTEDFSNQLTDTDLRNMLTPASMMNVLSEQEDIIKSFAKKSLARSIVFKLNSGELTFRTTNREYSTLGINEYSFGDSGVLWEAIEQQLGDEALSLFEDPKDTDRLLTALEAEIASGLVGVVLESKRKKRKRIIEELEKGRSVMLYLYENMHSNPFQDYGLIKRLYDMHETTTRVQRSYAGLNKFDIEEKLRKLLDSMLKSQGLQLVYSGSKSDSFDKALTLHFTSEKKRNLSPKSLFTFLESFLVCTDYANRGSKEQRDGYMVYKEFEDIKTTYEKEPTVSMASGLVPALSLIEIGAAQDIFSDRFTNPVSKAKKLFDTLIAPRLNVNILVIRIRVSARKVRITERDDFINPKSDRNSMLLPMIYVEHKTKRDIIRFFEPCFSLIG